MGAFLRRIFVPGYPFLHHFRVQLVVFMSANLCFCACYFKAWLTLLTTFIISNECPLMHEVALKQSYINVIVCQLCRNINNFHHLYQNILEVQ